MNERMTKINTYLEKAVAAEAAGNIAEAEKQWKFAIFQEARMLGISTKTHIADCCPAY